MTCSGADSLSPTRRFFPFWPPQTYSTRWWLACVHHLLAREKQTMTDNYDTPFRVIFLSGDLMCPRSDYASPCIAFREPKAD